MDFSVYVPVITGIVGVVGTLLVTRNTNSKDILVHNRTQLSADEQQFRRELREELRLAKEEIHELRGQIIELSRVNKAMVEEIAEYRAMIKGEKR
jgi:septal ring factor EnvC (AmiA/AmiB activator)